MDSWFRKATPEKVPQAEPAELDWDLKELLERLEGDQEFLRELLAMFLADYRACMHKAQPRIFLNSLAPPTLSRTCSGISR